MTVDNPLTKINMATRTSKADQNFFSIAENKCELYSGTDHPVPATIPNPPYFIPSDEGWDAVLKICDYTSDIHLDGVVVSQGFENAVDFNNRVQFVTLQNVVFGVNKATGDQVITIKGGCSNIGLMGRIFSHGRKADIVLGEWSDQSHDPVHDLDLSGIVRDDGKPVTVILSRTGDNIKLPFTHKVLVVRSILEVVYYWAKFIWVKITG